MDKQGKVVLVSGATGNQGGGAARALLADGWSVRALTRNPDGPAAQRLKVGGAEVVRGDLNDPASLRPALEGAYGVFSVQDFWEHGAEDEIRQGTNLADAAREAGVQHFVFSSVGGADRASGVSHFESKWQIEEHIRDLGLPATIFRPVFLMDNFNQPFYRPMILNGTLAVALKPDTQVQMIAAEDVGTFTARALGDPDRYLGRAMEIGAQAMTFPQAAEIFGQVIGRPVRFVQAPIERVRAMQPDVAAMYQWFEAGGYQADLEECRRLNPDMLTLDTWLRRTGWQNAPAPEGGPPGGPPWAGRPGGGPPSAEGRPSGGPPPVRESR